ncbi:hypothetical protein DA2_0640 [Desulfovibrio sp. A2]|nr:hypothetical protein DA2_0640 [Desulfovibrio sp. A2]
MGGGGWCVHGHVMPQSPGNDNPRQFRATRLAEEAVCRESRAECPGA